MCAFKKITRGFLIIASYTALPYLIILHCILMKFLLCIKTQHVIRLLIQVVKLTSYSDESYKPYH